VEKAIIPTKPKESAGSRAESKESTQSKKAGAGKKDKAEEAETKSDIQGWKGGCQLPLTRKMDSGSTLREELSSHIDEVLAKGISNQSTRLESISRWENQYKGIKPPKSYPFDKASNIAIPITRSNTDALKVRVEDTIFSYQKIVTCRPVTEEFVEAAPAIEKAINHWLRNEVGFKKKLAPALDQCMKTGTGILKIVPEKKTRAVYRYASEEELKNQDIPKYSMEHLGSKSKVVKVVQTVYEGPNIYPIDRADFIISADATEIDEAYMVGFRSRYRKGDLKRKARQGVWDEKESEKIMSPDKPTDIQDSRAESAGKELKTVEYTEPYEVWELWLKYDVDEDGEEDDIVVAFHRETKVILDAIYNPIFSGFRPFTKLVYSPVGFQFDGEGACEILEKLQVGIDTLENQRIDRMTQINGPLVLVRSGAGLDDYTLNPGKVQVVDDDLESAVRIINFDSNYYSTVPEEDRLIAYADRAVGLTPNVMGQSTANRPVAKETFALIQEANKKFKSGNENVRDGVGETIMKCIEMFAQYQPTYAYKDEENGQPIVHTVEFPIEDLRAGLKVEVYASSEVINQELRREAALTVYQLLSEWATKNASMVQALCSPQVPSDFKRWLVAQYAIGVKVIKRILDDFDQRDSDGLVIELPESFDVEKAIANSMDLMQQQQGPPGQPGMEGQVPGMPPTAPPPFVPPQVLMQQRGTPGEFIGG
jgi:hypothetical protein